MGKRIIQQARGHGSLTYRVRAKAYRYRIGYPPLGTEGKAKIVKILNSPAHSAPLIKLQVDGKNFYNLAFDMALEGQEIEIATGEARPGNILPLRDIPIGTRIYNIEVKPGDGGKLVRAAGASAMVVSKGDGLVKVLMPSKRQVIFNEKCRATVGVIAGHGRKEKPIVKAGKKYHIMKARNKLWPRTSAVKMNAVDHPFGSGRGKRIKPKIAKRNAPPGAKVGLIRPRRTGKKK